MEYDYIILYFEIKRNLGKHLSQNTKNKKNKCGKMPYFSS